MHISGMWRYSASNKWFLLAILAGFLFLLLSTFYALNMLDTFTLQAERWLLGRPQTGLDCVFLEWRRLGEAPLSLLFILILGVICAYAGYRRRVLPYLLLLLLLGLGVEVVGKQIITLTFPDVLRSGMTTLTCPQIQQEPLTTHLATSVGLWWMIPAPDPGQASWAQEVAAMPLDFTDTTSENSYPGGHAMRWCFIGLLAGWLAWRHVKRRPLRILFTTLALIMSFGGGFMQFYLGVHFLSDTLAGYLLGSTLACFAIGLLLLNDTRKRISHSF